jgi:thioredoxin 1
MEPEKKKEFVIPITDATYAQEVEAFTGVAIVDFWAPWCGPCRVMSPRIEELAEKYAEDKRVKVMSLNTDENQETSTKNTILSIPAFRFYLQGKVRDIKKDTIIGVSPIEELEEKLQELLALLPKEKPAAK